MQLQRSTIIINNKFMIKLIRPQQSILLDIIILDTVLLLRRLGQVQV